MRTYIRASDGTAVPETEACNASGTLRNGYRLSSILQRDALPRQMMLHDAAPKTPFVGSKRPLTVKTFAELNAAIGQREGEERIGELKAEERMAEKSQEEYVRRISNAWKESR